MLDLAHADDDRSNSPDPNPCAKSADDFEARAHLHTILYPSNLASRHRSSIGRVRPILLWHTVHNPQPVGRTPSS